VLKLQIFALFQKGRVVGLLVLVLVVPLLGLVFGPTFFGLHFLALQALRVPLCWIVKRGRRKRKRKRVDDNETETLKSKKLDCRIDEKIALGIKNILAIIAQIEDALRQAWKKSKYIFQKKKRNLAELLTFSYTHRN